MTELEVLQQQITELSTQLASANDQIRLLTFVIVGLFLALGIAMVFIARSVPPGHAADLLKLASDVLVKEGAGTALVKFEEIAKESPNVVDDLGAAAGRAAYNALYPSDSRAATPTGTTAEVLGDGSKRSTATVQAVNGPAMTATLTIETSEETAEG